MDLEFWKFMKRKTKPCLFFSSTFYFFCTFDVVSFEWIGWSIFIYLSSILGVEEKGKVVSSSPLSTSIIDNYMPGKPVSSSCKKKKKKIEKTAFQWLKVEDFVSFHVLYSFLHCFFQFFNFSIFSSSASYTIVVCELFGFFWEIGRNRKSAFQWYQTIRNDEIAR